MYELVLVIDNKQSGSGRQVLVLFAKEQMGVGELWEKKIGEYRTLKGLMRAIGKYYRISWV